MNFIYCHLKKFDWVLLVSAILLVCLGFISIYGSSLGLGNFLNLKKQIIFFGSGFLLMILISFLDFRILKDNSYLILFLYFISIMTLVGLFFVAGTRGVQRWYSIGSISIDPREFTKIILIIILAKYFSTRHVEMYKLRHIFLSGIYVFIPSFLIFLQPDLGYALILISLWIVILIISGVKIKHFLLLSLIFILIISFGWNSILKDYQKERVVSFMNLEADPLGSGWSQRQAKIAIGSGGVFGKGIGQGSQTQYGFLPETQNDFIFASLSEEMGLVGVLSLFFLFAVFIWRILRIAILSKNNFFRLFASGIATILISQFFVHVGMNLGVLPVVGISLPLVSYGGSGLIMTFLGIGFLESIVITSNI
jgi:rod shape determining protein RodA